MEKSSMIKLIISYLNFKGWKEISEKLELESKVTLLEEEEEIRVIRN